MFAKVLGATEENKRFNLVPVKPDWSNSTDLLGFRSIDGKFTPGIITGVCYKAMMNTEIPYFICLDEMNLARVEYYFSDILSLMETRRLNEDNDKLSETYGKSIGDILSTTMKLDSLRNADITDKLNL